MQDTVRLDEVERAISDIAAGKPVVVVDDASRENEGDIIFAAQSATPELMAFTVRHSSGVICVPMPDEVADLLLLPPMTTVNQDPKSTAFTVSVDAAAGVTTGISAADRAVTARLLADPQTTANQLTRPGHMFPLRAREGGVLVRRGHTEAAVDLVRAAGLHPVGILVEIVNDDGTMKRGLQLRDFADKHGLAMISIEQLVQYRVRNERLIERGAQTKLPTSVGDFTAVGYRSLVDGNDHVALVMGDISTEEPVLVRAHSECLTGDVFGSKRCDCGPQLDESLRRIAELGRGVVIYLRGHEGRGIGLQAKLSAYALQDNGRDTVDANLELGFPADAREYSAAAAIIADLGVQSVWLLTNNPDKIEGLAAGGVEIAGRVPLCVPPNVHNIGYLAEKRDRMGHDLPGLDVRERTYRPTRQLRLARS
ncbi:bifunctional 3,4-dihydroxy-2-butanone-4-phosphate synthase/GTP cyclohydrolase II [Mycolicibacterium diernhoferi]|uniref:Riboflavin biosynthesis protein RibBA n=1 Tax=Mycolicibacterium diernhoferi TaxID=1801 RepID=A0A1Q4H3V3_9MYCO|nr:bifunctional 3,4-dihydroxy-2-butanone-4-phosphate synthase/GTP cyclohydrolase II [Mycolicibacterium diernhoferi]OJZ61199.1 bifunctional 3,4-dihydroxy-2-butanone 4-phosphate synthase/GTP cyclohydrolase II [Mycolicibacterium diernhoferi]OPE54905.1 bifunctional 3,4-dihydroxy-2-butanone 4-phosphate synthase/GTP cyclohydrolase II [Mycolicibacterium diernhoferi]PEG51283.1 bifunctional 3,4-dihydroxy-2-butanone-4-phosphate synthase/GTP cyclohydrolase II [Mycolicibacterium diernhoferi]QYL23767.1 bifu